MPDARLPSWNDGPARGALLDFVDAVTAEGGPDYVAPADRVATFDNDGTLWVEQPIYVQGLFVLSRAEKLCAAHPELAAKPAFQALLKRDVEALATIGKRELVEALVLVHAGDDEEAFQREVTEWLAAQVHPRFQRPCLSLTYAPMLELLDLLHDNGFRCFIVTGGGLDFVRCLSEGAYGIPRERVVGSSNKTSFVLADGRADVVKQAALASYDEYDGKPVNIALHVGRRPLLAFGNSDGDLAMLQYAAGGAGRRLALLLHHDDPEREYAYDRDSVVGKLDVALDEAAKRGWPVVSMQRDWKRVFADWRH